LHNGSNGHVFRIETSNATGAIGASGVTLAVPDVRPAFRESAATPTRHIGHAGQVSNPEQNESVKAPAFFFTDAAEFSNASSETS
jgi:hypothetical protein